MGQRGDAHGHALALLSLGRAGGGEADADHFVDRSEQAELGKTLEVPEAERGQGQETSELTTHLLYKYRVLI